MNRQKRDNALRVLRQVAGQGLHAALLDLLVCELESAWEEMESAETDLQIWRAQGRAALARELRDAITPR